MKTNIYTVLIVLTVALLYILGTAVQFQNHSLVGIAAFVGIGCFCLGIVAGMWGARVDAKLRAERMSAVHIRHH